MSRDAPMEPRHEAGPGGHALPDPHAAGHHRHAVGVVAARRRRGRGQRSRPHAHADLPPVAVAGHRRRTEPAPTGGRPSRTAWRCCAAATPSGPLFVPWDDTVRARFATVEQDWATFKRALGRRRAPVDVAELRAQAAGFVDAHRRAGRRHRGPHVALDGAAAPAADRGAGAGRGRRRDAAAHRLPLRAGAGVAAEARHRAAAGRRLQRPRQRQQQRRVRHAGRRLQRAGRAPAVDVPQPRGQGRREDLASCRKRANACRRCTT